MLFCRGGSCWPTTADCTRRLRHSLIGGSRPIRDHHALNGSDINYRADCDPAWDELANQTTAARKVRQKRVAAQKWEVGSGKWEVQRYTKKDQGRAE